MKMALSLLTTTFPISSKVLVDTFISLKDGEVGLEWYKDRHETTKKTLYISASGFKKFISFKKTILSFFHKALSKQDVTNFDTVLDMRSNGVVKLLLYKFQEVPLCSMTFYRTQPESAIEKFKPTGYMIVMNAGEVIALFEKYEDNICKSISKLEGRKYIPIIFECMSRRIFHYAIEIYKSLNGDKMENNVSIVQIIQTYYPEIKNKCTSEPQYFDESGTACDLTSMIMNEIEMRFGSYYDNISLDAISQYVETMFSNELNNFKKAGEKLFAAWILGIMLGEKSSTEECVKPPITNEVDSSPFSSSSSANVGLSSEESVIKTDPRLSKRSTSTSTSIDMPSLDVAECASDYNKVTNK